MGVLNTIKNFFLRLLIYLVVLLWPLSKLQNLYQNVEEFKKIIFRNLALYKFKFDPKENNDSILIFFFFYTCAECLFSILGIFNFAIGHIFSIILFVLTNFIYFNPFIEENSIKLLNTKPELFYNIGILISLGLLAFYPKIEEKNQQPQNEISKTLNFEDEEMKKSMPVKKNKKKNKY